MTNVVKIHDGSWAYGDDTMTLEIMMPLVDGSWVVKSLQDKGVNTKIVVVSDIREELTEATRTLR